jgi:hypothetical protein
MKNKLRKITIDNNVYQYHIRTNYYLPGSTEGLTLTIFLNGKKQTPLVIDFFTLSDLYKGHPLNNGIQLLNVKTNELVQVNIHEPKYIREIILLGIKNGWEGTNTIPNQNGLAYLTEMGFDASSIQPPNLPERWAETSVYLNVLADITFPIADKLLEKQGTFSPLAAVITEDGAILNLANEMQEGLPQQEAVNNLKKIVKAGTITSHYVGCVILYIDRVVNLFTNKTIDAVAIYYESTREKKRCIYYYPYRFTAKKRVTYLRSWGAIGDKEVFI